MWGKFYHGGLDLARYRSHSPRVKWSTTYFRDIPFPDLEALHQETREGLRTAPGQGVFLVSEPQPTYTAGRAADPAGLLWTAEAAEAKGVRLVPVGRGGQWTFHGPGQVVVYPLVALRSLGYSSKGVRRFLGELRGAVVDFLSELGIQADPEDAARPFGVYVGNGKLVSFGIAVERGVSGHGLALYLKDQNPAFQGIHPCGVPGERLASLEALGVDLAWETAANRLIDHLKKRLSPPKTC
jgi:lipoyl(octanoyl) transferase